MLVSELKRYLLGLPKGLTSDPTVLSVDHGTDRRVLVRIRDAITVKGKGLLVRAEEPGTAAKPFPLKALLNAVLTLPKVAMDLQVVAVLPDGSSNRPVSGVDALNEPEGGCSAGQVVLTVDP
jgi:hypothetical protein